MASFDFARNGSSALADEIRVPIVLDGEELFERVEGHFKDAGATNPENAPNYKLLPVIDRPKAPNNSEEEIKSGKYVPQNWTNKPYDLSKFPITDPQYL